MDGLETNPPEDGFSHIMPIGEFRCFPLLAAFLLKSLSSSAKLRQVVTAFLIQPFIPVP